MAKGHGGKSCREVIAGSLSTGEVEGFQELYRRVFAHGSWRDSTILQHLMSCVVNLLPARQHWRNVEPFLFLRAKPLGLQDVARKSPPELAIGDRDELFFHGDHRNLEYGPAALLLRKSDQIFYMKSLAHEYDGIRLGIVEAGR